MSDCGDSNEVEEKIKESCKWILVMNDEVKKEKINDGLGNEAKNRKRECLTVEIVRK